MIIYNKYIYILYIYMGYILYPMDPSIFLGSVWGMIWGVKYLFGQRLDP